MSVPRERLRELKEALLWGDPLDQQTRCELVGLLEYIEHSASKKRGRPMDEALRRRAGVAWALIDKHNVPLKAALFAAAPNADAKARACVLRAFQAMRATDERVTVHPRDVRAALTVLGRK